MTAHTVQYRHAGLSFLFKMVVRRRTVQPLFIFTHYTAFVYPAVFVAFHLSCLIFQWVTDGNLHFHWANSTKPRDLKQIVFIQATNLAENMIDKRMSFPFKLFIFAFAVVQFTECASNKCLLFWESDPFCCWCSDFHWIMNPWVLALMSQHWVMDCPWN